MFRLCASKIYMLHNHFLYKLFFTLLSNNCHINKTSDCEQKYVQRTRYLQLAEILQILKDIWMDVFNCIATESKKN